MRIENPTYYQEAVGAAYPFDDGASRDNGLVRIDDDVFVDARLFPPDGSEDVFLSRIDVAEEMRLTVANRRQELGFGVFSRNAPPDYVNLQNADGVYVGILQSYPGDAVSAEDGVIASRGLAKLCGWPDGSYSFQHGQTRFTATALIPQPQIGVRSIRAAGARFSGDVTLVGERGVQLTMQDGAVRVDLVGDPLAARRKCDEDEVPFVSAQVLRGLVLGGEAIYPDVGGGLTLLVGGGPQSAGQPGLRIVPVDGGLRVLFIGGTP